MQYPQFLRTNDTIGVCAPSAGVGRKIEAFEKSLNTLKAEGWNILETEHVRLDEARGGSAKERAEELMSLFRLSSVNAVIASSGGDFLSEILPFVDWNVLFSHPKWLSGSSDPTGLLFPLTTCGDIATIYGFNAGSFDARIRAENKASSDHSEAEGLSSGSEFLPEYLKNAIRILRGETIIQNNFPMHLGTAPFLQDDAPLTMDTSTIYKSNVKRLHVSGRCIGGCIDCLKDLIGTEYDKTKDFLRRYQNDGVIWYLDNFSLTSAVLYRTLLQFRYAGWITPSATRAVLIGRTLFKTEEAGITYEEAIRMAFPDVPVIWDMDIGHTVPHFTMVNGAMLDLKWDDPDAELRFAYI